MAVSALRTYVFEPADAEKNFHGLRIVYVGWDKHLMFASPFMLAVTPDSSFGDLVAKNLADAYGAHPDFAKVDWSKVEWLKNSQPWTPDFGKSVDANGIRHKDLLRFRTPGLAGIGGKDI
ncbi:MAG: phenol hydroxylase [Rhodocyclaceae bacterium]|nr:MAG: phenol hydroxylase [Rhodocyclaceae bacterium]